MNIFCVMEEHETLKGGTAGESQVSVRDAARALGLDSFTLLSLIQHDRVNYDQPQLSFLHRIVASERVSHIVTRTRQQWLLEALRFLSAECQVWLFRLRSDRS